MLGSRHEIARLQSDFYRDQYRKTLRWLMVMMVVIFILIAGIIYAVLARKQQQYYANTTEGKILAMPRQL
jgi:Na+-transporting NADH:ubiquinone oxidoreductase subunit NqrC